MNQAEQQRREVAGDHAREFSWADWHRSPLPAFVPPAWYNLAARRAAPLDRCADVEPHAYDLELALR
jgi:hypothetical protein